MLWLRIQWAWQEVCSWFYRQTKEYAYYQGYYDAWANLQRFYVENGLLKTQAELEAERLANEPDEPWFATEEEAWDDWWIENGGRPEPV